MARSCVDIPRGGKHKPPQLVQGFLVQGTENPTHWRTVCIWQSSEALEEFEVAHEMR